jgi:hypothetical protein
MIIYILKILLMAIGAALLALPVLKSKNNKVKFVCGIVGAAIFFTSFGFYYIPEKNSGHVTTTIGTQLKSGRLIALTENHERGLQSKLLMPDFGYDIRHPFFMEIDIKPDFEVPPKNSLY